VKYFKGKNIGLNDGLPNEEVQKYCQPVYTVLNGYDYIVGSSDSKKNSHKNTLHPNLEIFLKYLEDKTGANIISIGTGPKTHEMIYLKK
jgi:adenylosuccinate synthase